MSYQLATLNVDHPLLEPRDDAKALRDAIDELLHDRSIRHRRLWAYYDNPMRTVSVLPESTLGGSERPYRQAQEWGLPPRITGYAGGEEPWIDTEIETGRKEVVIENDIGWRIDTMVDFLFSRPIVLDSAAPDPDRAATIGELLRQILTMNGGLGFLQRMALLGAIYGGVDVLVKFDRDALDQAEDLADCSTGQLGGGAMESNHDPAPIDVPLARLAACIRLELVEPARALPLLASDDATRPLAYAQVYQVPRQPHERLPQPPRATWLGRLLWPSSYNAQEPVTVVELITPDEWQLYRDAKLVDAGAHGLGMLPVVHVQNIVRPFKWDGGSDVEPLIPLQDQLNTRLSDRAYRVALQSMKMYLGIGIPDFSSESIEPGRMWSSDNLDARVMEFGGDANSPSEEAAIREVREALDKQSGVNPVAAGAIRGRVGNLTSAAALRLTFQSLLSRTERKRTSYGAAIERICELSLLWLDKLGLFATARDERRVRIGWPDPIPSGVSELLEQARLKQNLGIDPDTVRRELGY